MLDMGLWAQFVIVRSAAPVGLPHSIERGVHDGFSYAEFGGKNGLDIVQTFAGRGTPAIAAFVADSDCAAVAWAAQGTESDWLAINRSYDESDDDHTDLWLDETRRRAACEALATWSQHAPRPTTGDELFAALTRVVDEEASAELDGEPRLLFCEDALRLVFEDCLGFRSLDATVFAAEEEQFDI